MGASSSSPAPWREISWGNKAGDLQHVKNFQLDARNQKIRILVAGPCGAGKSSFINSVHSVLLGRMYALAGVENVCGASFTDTYTTYSARKEGGTSCYPFVFSDTMGLDAHSGILVDDVILALKGHVREGYKFRRGRGLSEEDPHYNSAPSRDDKVHVLVHVVAANSVAFLNSGVLQQIQRIRTEARVLGIPQVALLTKIDEVSPEIRADLRNVYRDKFLKQEMEKFSMEAGFPLNGIFPVKNYHEENAIKDEMDSLILDALRNILNFGRDYIQSRSSAERLVNF